MTYSYELFRSLLTDAKTFAMIHEHFLFPPEFDGTDLFRWQWVQGVSALDKFVHDIVRVGMIEIYQEKRGPTQKWLAFEIPVDVHRRISESPENALALLEGEIQRKHKRLSFQTPENIADGLSFIWEERYKWQVLSGRMNWKEKDAKTYLKNISIRRNQIVHEGDYPSRFSQRQSISWQETEAALDYLLNLGDAIYQSVKA